MALGPAKVKVEIMPAAAWVDISDRVDLDSTVRVRPACSPTPWADVEAGSCTFTVDDPTGELWPGNPSSQYFGLLRKGMPVRVTATLGTATSVRHVGRVRLVTPTLTGSVGVGTRVTFTSTDVLADLQGRSTDDRLTEELRAAARTTWSNGSDAWDVWPLTGSPTDGSIPSTREGSTNAGLVVWPKSKAGSVSFNSLDGATVDGPLTLPAMATFEPSGAVGPVMTFPVTAQTSGQFYFAFRTGLVAQRTIAAGFDGSGNMVWQFEVQTDSTLTLRNGQGLAPGNWGSSQPVTDGAWHTVVGYINASAVPGAGQQLLVFLDGTFLTLTYDTSSVRTICVGGYMPPGQRGKQQACFQGDVTLIGTLGAAGVGSVEHLCAMTPVSPALEWQRLNGYAGSLLGAALASTWKTSAQVVTGPTQESNLLDLMRTVARSCGGRITLSPAGLPQQVALRLPENPAPTLTTDGSTAFTVTLSQDDADGLSFTLGADEDPTRVLVNGPFASGLYVGDESDGRQDDQMTTWSASQGDATAIGGGWVNTRPSGLRVNRLPVDLATSASGQTLVDWLFAAIPMQSVFTLAGIPSVVMGVTQTNLIAVGWDETYSMTQSLFELDTFPAEFWPRAVLATGATERSIVGTTATGAHTVTAGSAAVGTGTASTLTVSSSGALFATGKSLRLSWKGECVTGSFTGAASPQTLTLTGRGQQGTVARTHTDGEPITIWRPARAGMG